MTEFEFVAIGEEALVFVRDGVVRLMPVIRGGGGGSAGSTKSTQQSSQVDPWLSKINELAYGQIKSGIEQTGGLPAYLQENPYALPSEAEKGFIGQIGTAAAESGGLQDLESQGLANLARLGDPSAQLDYASNLYSRYGAPIVANDATVAGQRRSGAVPEALASGFAKIALPIMDRATGYRGELAGQQLRLGPELADRRIGALETQLRASGAERIATSEEYMRPLQAIASIVGGLPLGGGTVTGYATGKTSATRGDFDVLGDLIIPLVGAVAGGAAGCWLATKCVGMDALWFRVWLAQFARWYERLLYRVTSRVLSWSPLAVRALTPVIAQKVAYAKARV